MSTSATVVRESTGRIVGLSWHRFPPDLTTDVRPLFGPAARRDPALAETREFVMPATTASPAAQLEREAHARGFAEGERQANAAAAARYDAAAERLLEAARELQSLRTGFLARSEQDVLHLAIAVAERVLGQAVAHDRSLLLRTARQALDRLAEPMLATIQLRPEDLDALPDEVKAEFSSGPVRLEAASHLSPGGCLVQTPRGAMDVSIEAQLKEILDGLAPHADRD